MAGISAWQAPERLIPDIISHGIAAMLIPFGGIGAFIYEGDRVFIKPHAQAAAPPRSAQNNDPRFVEALVNLCFDAGAKEVVLGEAVPADISAEMVFETSGLAEAAARSGAQLVDLRCSQVVKRQVPQPLAFETLSLCGEPLQADVFINLAKLKTGRDFSLDCAFRNLLPLAAGEEQARLLRQLDRGLIDLYGLIRPDLTIIEGLSASFLGEIRPSQAVLAGIDMVALDTVAATVMGAPLERAAYLQTAAQHGFGTCDSGEISIFGADLRPIIEKFTPQKGKGMH